MDTFQHPQRLNPYQQYRQACAILKSTNRASNDAWYKEALDLDFQLHLRADGAGVVSRVFNRKTGLWTEGPVVTDETLRDPDKISAFADAAVAFAKQSGMSSLGVVLHIAGEFATAELKPELDNPAALPDLKAAAEHDPISILDDSSVSPEQSAWRVLPYPAAGSETIGTSITLSRQFAPFCDAMRAQGEARNFPVVVHALSAPLMALLAIPELFQPTPGRPLMIVLQYEMFTTLAFFNEHRDLRLLRTLHHRGQRRPSNIRHAAATTIAALEFHEPDVLILPLGAHADATMGVELRSVFPVSRVETVDWNASPYSNPGIPFYAPELLISTSPPPAADAPETSHTFTILRSEKWATQNFLTLPREIAEVYPARGEMKLLRAVRLIRLGIAACGILAVSWAAFGLVEMIRKPEWTFDIKESSALKGRVAALNLEAQRIERWDNLLEDRSKAWTSMELLARLFPERSGVLVKGFHNVIKPESAPGKEKIGFVKEWKIGGYARDEALDLLNSINSREGISAAFSEIARITGNSSFSTDSGTRSIVVNLSTQENSSFRPRQSDEILDDDSSTYPFSFVLTIAQRFEAADPMALNVGKIP